jgi:hypothetical protein
MKKFLINYNEVPAGGFRYTDPETKAVISAPSWRELLHKAKDHRRANQLPIGAGFDDEVEQQLAGVLPESQVTTTDPNRKIEVPRQDWPMWAKMIAAKARPEDRGVGDTIERTLGPVGGDAFKRWYQDIFGRSCGCGTRRDLFNLQYPYGPENAA